MTETMMDDMFSTPEMDQEADDEMNRVLMEVAGVKLDGMKLTPVAQPAVHPRQSVSCLLNKECLKLFLFVELLHILLLLVLLLVLHLLDDLGQMAMSASHPRSTPTSRCG